VRLWYSSPCFSVGSSQSQTGVTWRPQACSLAWNPLTRRQQLCDPKAEAEGGPDIGDWCKPKRPAIPVNNPAPKNVTDSRVIASGQLAWDANRGMCPYGRILLASRRKGTRTPLRVRENIRNRNKEWLTCVSSCAMIDTKRFVDRELFPHLALRAINPRPPLGGRVTPLYCQPL